MSLNSIVNEEALSANVNKVPGKVYLCQTGDELSCGACCGLYNLPFESKNALYAFLYKRTLLFDQVARNADDILLFCNKEQKRIDELGFAPVKDFHHCPYLGLMGADLDKPGCLLHPYAEKNNSVDFRGLSYYGGLACASYFCPTYYAVEPLRKLIVREVIRDWYEYGLIITEADMINNIFDFIEKELGRAFNIDDLTLEISFHLADLFKLKLNWPYEQCLPYPVNFFFKDGELRKNPYIDNSKYSAILYAVKADISTDEELKRAEFYIEKKITALSNNLL